MRDRLRVRSKVSGTFMLMEDMNEFMGIAWSLVRIQNQNRVLKLLCLMAYHVGSDIYQH